MKEQLELLLQKYDIQWRGEPVRGESGWNNTTWYIQKNPETVQAVLRIYETHRDADKIAYEHAVLQALQYKELLFRIPSPIKTLAGETFVRLEDGSGRLACMFVYLEGARPKEGDFSAAEAFGKAAGELTLALAAAEETLKKRDIQPVYRPYFELPAAYPLCKEEVIARFCFKPEPDFLAFKEELETLYSCYNSVIGKLPGLKLLPQQLVHGDLNFSNLLVQTQDSEQIAALLDFEFCTRDVRAMEAAVVLAGLLEEDSAVGSKEGDSAIRRFCRGYGTSIKLSAEEAGAIPVLMELRCVDVFLHFVSRLLNGTDKPAVLQEQIPMLASDLIGMRTHAAEIQQLVQQYL